MESGSILVPRSRFEEGSTWLKTQPASPDEAWLDIIQMAAQEDTSIKSGRSTVKLRRGHVLVSVRFLSERWNWSTGKVYRWLKSSQEAEHLVERGVTPAGNIYLVEKYDTYVCDRNTLLRSDETPSVTAPSGGGDIGEESFSSLVVPTPAVLQYPCEPGKGGGGRLWDLTQDRVDEWQRIFPGVDVLVEARKALAWLKDHKLKTYRGMPAFLSKWLGNAQDQSSWRGKLDFSAPARRSAEDLEFASSVYARYAWSWGDVYRRLGLEPPPTPSEESCIEPILRARDELAKTYPDANLRISEAMREANKDRFLRGAHPKFPTPNFSISKILEISQYRNKPIELSDHYRSKPVDIRDIHPEDIDDETVTPEAAAVYAVVMSESGLFPQKESDELRH